MIKSLMFTMLSAFCFAQNPQIKILHGKLCDEYSALYNDDDMGMYRFTDTFDNIKEEKKDIDWSYYNMFLEGYYDRPDEIESFKDKIELLRRKIRQFYKEAAVEDERPRPDGGDFKRYDKAKKELRQSNAEEDHKSFVNSLFGN